MNGCRPRKGAMVAIPCLAFLLLVTAGLAVGAAPESQSLVHKPVALGETVSVITRVSLAQAGEERNDGGNEGIWLAGLATDADAEPHALALTWAPVSAGWFGAMWGVQLQSSAGLIPEKLYPRDGTDFFAESAFLALGSGLKWGKEYECVLSYHAGSGAASVLITEVDSGTQVLSRGFQLNPHGGPLYPGAGYRFDASVGPPVQLASIRSLEAAATFVPVGVPWYWLQAPATSDAFDVVGELDRRQRTAIRVDFPWSEVPAALRVVGEASSGQRIVLATVQDLGGSVVVPIPTANLPVGSLRLQPELLTGDSVWALEAKETTFGIVRMGMEGISVQEQRDGSEVLEGRLSVQNDGPVPGAVVKVAVNLKQYDDGQETQLLDGAVVLQYDLGRPGLAENLTLPFRIQLSTADSPAVRERWWVAHLEASVEPANLGLRAVEQDWVISPIITAEAQLPK